MPRARTTGGEQTWGRTPRCNSGSRQTNDARKAKAKATEANNKRKVRELAAKVADIRDEMADPSFSMLNRHLETLIRYKTQKGDKKLPTKKAEMEQRWNEIKGRQSPHVSPYNSGEESEEDASDDDANGDGSGGSDDSDDSNDGEFDDGDDLAAYFEDGSE